MADRQRPRSRPIATLVAFLVIVGCWMLWMDIQTNKHYSLGRRRQQPFFEQKVSTNDDATAKLRMPRDCWLNPPWGDNSLQDERNFSQRICAVRGQTNHAERNLVSPSTSARTLTCPPFSAAQGALFASAITNLRGTNDTTNTTTTLLQNSTNTSTLTTDAENNNDNNNNDKISMVLLYYSNPRGLLLHLERIAEYPSHLQNQIEVLWIIDDGSPPGLQANEYLALVNTYTISFPIRVARVTENIAWNMPGTQNLGFYLVPDNAHVLLLDLDTMISPRVFQRLLYHVSMNTQQKQHDNTNGTHTLSKEAQLRDDHQHVVYRFYHNVERRIQHPKIMLIKKETYWHIGGFEEDFVPHYGHDDYAFWYRFKLCGEPSCHMVTNDLDLVIQRPNNTNNNNSNNSTSDNSNRTRFDGGSGDSACDVDDWLGVDDGDGVATKENSRSTNNRRQRNNNVKCLNALKSLPNPPKRDDIPTNKKLFQRRRFTQCWSNHYLRFDWVIE